MAKFPFYGGLTNAAYLARREQWIGRIAMVVGFVGDVSRTKRRSRKDVIAWAHNKSVGQIKEEYYVIASGKPTSIPITEESNDQAKD